MANDQDDLSTPEGLRAAYERANARANEAAETAQAQATELAKIQAAQRQESVRSQLRTIGAPEKIADVYPADADVSEQAIRGFLKENLGMEPDMLESWGRYSASQGGESGAPGAPEDEWVKYAKEQTESLHKFYRNQYKPSPKEEQDTIDLKHKIFDVNLPKWDQQVASGQMLPLVDPMGFGGLIDPPSYARRAKFFPTSQPS